MTLRRRVSRGLHLHLQLSVIIEFDGVMIEVDDGWLERFNGSAALEAS